MSIAQTFTAPKITEGVIWKQLLSFFFPILLGTFFQQLYNTVDAIIVGRFVGTQALAAVGATSALINLFNGFFIGVSTGATVLISQFYGGSNRSGARDALHTGMVLSVILGLLATALGIFTGPQLLHLMQTPASCMDDAPIYLRLYFSGALASMIYNMGSGILRAMGDSKRPLLFFGCRLCGQCGDGSSVRGDLGHGHRRRCGCHGGFSAHQRTACAAGAGKAA